MHSLVNLSVSWFLLLSMLLLWSIVVFHAISFPNFLLSFMLSYHITKHPWTQGGCQCFLFIKWLRKAKERWRAGVQLTVQARIWHSWNVTLLSAPWRQIRSLLWLLLDILRTPISEILATLHSKPLLFASLNFQCHHPLPAEVVRTECK